MIVVVPWSGGTLELLSYELTGAELSALVASVREVDEDGWRAAGGRLR